MSGVRLLELSATDMLDVIHYFFEDDVLSSSSKEEVDAKAKVRLTIYRDMYNRHYNYAGSSSSSSYIDQSIVDEELSKDEDGNIPVPVNPRERSASAIPPKPYVPPTVPSQSTYTPFGEGIDAPLG